MNNLWLKIGFIPNFLAEIFTFRDLELYSEKSITRSW